MDFAPQPMNFQNAPERPDALPTPDTAPIRNLEHTPANMTDPYKMLDDVETAKASTGTAQLLQGANAV